MKDRRYANRGMTFERQIETANFVYANRGEAFIQKIPTEFLPIRDPSGRICSVKVEHQATVDFLGRYGPYPIAIEAKNTNTDSIRFDVIQPNQAADMMAFTKQSGTIGLVLIRFDGRKFYAIPWDFWEAAYDLRVRRKDKSTELTIYAHGQKWTVPQKFSVRRDELNPAWEVHISEYLENAKKYVSTEMNAFTWRSETQNK